MGRASFGKTTITKLQRVPVARGRYLSLEEARKQGKLDQFAKEHPAEGDMNLWDRLFHAMAGVKTPPEADQTSGRDGDED